MSIPERISRGMNGIDGHVFRYYLAAGLLEHGDTVLDAACGIGYGCNIMSRVPGVRCVGVDRQASEDFKFYGNGNVSFEVVDLLTYAPIFEYDVFVGFETIEHLPDVSHYLDLAKMAKKWIILSAPVVPTAGRNPYHVKDFRPGEVPDLVVNEDWALFQSVSQPSELSEIYVFKRRSLEVKL